MAENEGIRRLKVLSRRIMLVGFTVAAVLLILWTIDTFVIDRKMAAHAFVVVFIPWVTIPLIIGGAIRVLAWLIEGFASTSGPAREIPNHPIR